MYPASPVVPGLNDRTVTVNGVTHKYAVWLPQGFDSAWRQSKTAEPLPTIVFLHGRGECGTDGRRQTTVGLGPALAKNPARWGFVVVMPQKPQTDSAWMAHEAMVLAVIADAQKEFNTDPTRTYLTGLSQGGAGTWALGSKHAHMFAAIAPVCGYGSTEAAAGLANMPVWAFHGGRDRVVPVERSQALVEATIAAKKRAAGATPSGGDSGRAEVTLTVYPEADHNSWDKAYAEDLPAWLLRHRIAAPK